MSGSPPYQLAMGHKLLLCVDVWGGWKEMSLHWSHISEKDKLHSVLVNKVFIDYDQYMDAAEEEDPQEMDLF